MNEGVDTTKYPNAKEVREWGMRVNPRAVAPGGRLPAALVRAWNKANPDRPYVASQGWHGDTIGYDKGCHCDRCLEAGRRRHRQGWRNRTEAQQDGAA